MYIILAGLVSEGEMKCDSTRVTFLTWTQPRMLLAHKELQDSGWIQRFILFALLRNGATVLRSIGTELVNRLYSTYVFDVGRSIYFKYNRRAVFDQKWQGQFQLSALAQKLMQDLECYKKELQRIYSCSNYVFCGSIGKIIDKTQINAVIDMLWEIESDYYLQKKHDCMLRRDLTPAEWSKVPPPPKVNASAVCTAWRSILKGDLYKSKCFNGTIPTSDEFESNDSNIIFVLKELFRERLYFSSGLLRYRNCFKIRGVKVSVDLLRNIIEVLESYRLIKAFAISVPGGKKSFIYKVLVPKMITTFSATKTMFYVYCKHSVSIEALNEFRDNWEDVVSNMCRVRSSSALSMAQKKKKKLIESDQSIPENFDEQVQQRRNAAVKDVSKYFGTISDSIKNWESDQKAVSEYVNSMDNIDDAGKNCKLFTLPPNHAVFGTSTVLNSYYKKTLKKQFPDQDTDDFDDKEGWHSRITKLGLSLEALEKHDSFEFHSEEFIASIYANVPTVHVDNRHSQDDESPADSSEVPSHFSAPNDSIIISSQNRNVRIPDICVPNESVIISDGIFSAMDVDPAPDSPPQKAYNASLAFCRDIAVILDKEIIYQYGTIMLWHKVVDVQPILDLFDAINKFFHLWDSYIHKFIGIAGNDIRNFLYGIDASHDAKNVLFTLLSDPMKAKGGLLDRQSSLLSNLYDPLCKHLAADESLEHQLESVNYCYVDNFSHLCANMLNRYQEFQLAALQHEAKIDEIIEMSHRTLKSVATSLLSKHSDFIIQCQHRLFSMTFLKNKGHYRLLTFILSRLIPRVGSIWGKESNFNSAQHQMPHAREIQQLANFLADTVLQYTRLEQSGNLTIANFIGNMDKGTLAITFDNDEQERNGDQNDEQQRNDNTNMSEHSVPPHDKQKGEMDEDDDFPIASPSVPHIPQKSSKTKPFVIQQTKRKREDIVSGLQPKRAKFDFCTKPWWVCNLDAKYVADMVCGNKIIENRTKGLPGDEEGCIMFVRSNKDTAKKMAKTSQRIFCMTYMLPLQQIEQAQKLDPKFTLKMSRGQKKTKVFKSWWHIKFLWKLPQPVCMAYFMHQSRSLDSEDNKNVKKELLCQIQKAYFERDPLLLALLDEAYK